MASDRHTELKTPPYDGHGGPRGIIYRAQTFLFVGVDRVFKRWRREFSRDESGIVLTETLIILPVLIILTFGILEFGNMLWQRQQLQVGVRDAARYWARCRPVANGSAFMPCTIQTAQNIAFYGKPTVSPSDPLRVPGWSQASQLTIAPATPVTLPTPTSLVYVEGSMSYLGSPVYSAIFGSSLTIAYDHTERYIGW